MHEIDTFNRICKGKELKNMNLENILSSEINQSQQIKYQCSHSYMQSKKLSSWNLRVEQWFLQVREGRDRERLVSA
jgi:hypothetical protein